MKTVAWVTLYFACCFGLILFLKRLFLAHYQIAFHGLSAALVGALVVGKVVVLLEKAPIHRWIGNLPVVVDVGFRTAFYTLGAVAALFLEHAFGARHEYGGFSAAIVGVFQHRDASQVWATVLCVGLSFLAFITGSTIRWYVGDEQLSRLFFSTKLREFEARSLDDVE